MSFHFSSDETWLLRQELFGALENVAFIALHINLNKVHLVLDKFELMHLLVEHLDIKLPTPYGRMTGFVSFPHETYPSPMFQVGATK